MTQEEQRPKSRRGCLIAIIVAQAVLLLLIVAVVGLAALAGMAAAKGQGGAHGRGEDECPDLREIWSWGGGTTKVALVQLHGLILLSEEETFFPGAGTAMLALQAIRRATHDPEVEALILHVDSGGGGITSSDVLYEALLAFKKAREGRKVVALFTDVAASGAYYVAMAADHIVAHPTTVTGSIGVLWKSLNFKELGQKIGVKDVTIKSGPNKDILNPLGDLTEEQRQMLQGVIDELHGRFVALVAQGRNLDVEKVRAIGDGRIMTASQAADLGLVDQIGYWKDAVARTAELLGVESIRVLRYEKEFSLAQWLRGHEWQPTMMRLMQEASQPRLLYLWRPFD